MRGDATEGAYRGGGTADIAASLIGKVAAVFDSPEEGPSLVSLALDLLERQKISWPVLAEAYGDLEDLRCREIDCGSFSVLAQFNPRRIASSEASVDTESLSKRNCFLCPASLPADQRSILYRGNYLVLCNPAPIVPEHFTIVHLSHLPQAIEGNIMDFLCLARELSPRFSVFYNGPRCGASAPDHLHYQVIPAGVLPIERDVSRAETKNHIGTANGVLLFRAEGLGREVWIIEGRDQASMDATLQRITTALGRYMSPGSSPGEEPMLNLLGTFREGMWRVAVFPRRKHRPAAFYREGEARLILTPAAVEMGGLLITPLERDYHRLDATLIRDIYEEVSLDEEEAYGVLKTLAGAVWQMPVGAAV